MGSLSINDDGESKLLNEIKLEMINKYFPNEYNSILEENNSYKRKIEYLANQRKRNQSRADKYRNENEILKDKLLELESILDKLQ